MNQLFVYPLIVSSSSLIGMRQRFTDFPSFGELVSQVLIVYFIEDFFFYWAHRLFHTFPALYKMHKIHHEYDKIYTFATEYFHPLDFGLGNVVRNY
jgi:sterol desaturase/sphingolipid hydroxylase (fatty acid hydroxylase superfamily)